MNHPDAGKFNYLSVLAMATSASMGREKVWGFAVALEGRVADEATVNALPTALREGRIADLPVPGDCDLPRFGERALDQLISRNGRQGGANRAKEFGLYCHGCGSGGLCYGVGVSGRWSARAAP